MYIPDYLNCISQILTQTDPLFFAKTKSMNLKKITGRRSYKYLLVAKIISKITIILLATHTNLFGQLSVASPDGKLYISTHSHDTLRLAVHFNGRTIQTIDPQLVVDSQTLTANISLKNFREQHVRDTLRPVISGGRSHIPDIYNQLNIKLSKSLSLEIRVYNDGWGYRFATHLDKEVSVDHEGYSLYNHTLDSIWFPEETSYLSHSERLYPHLKIKDIAEGRFCSLPALLHGNECFVAISEAWIEDFPGMYLEATGKNALSTTHPPFPLEEKAVNDRTLAVTKSAPFVARTKGKRTYPWRVFGVTSTPGDLVGSDLVYRFGPPQQIDKTDWIKPGKVAWDWWNDNNISGVDFKSGVNTKTYKYYIDFAADYNLDYIILDEGWSNPSDLFDIHPEMDMDALFSYAKQKEVGIILWVLFNTLDKQLDSALVQFAKWGAKGIKVDFMQRDDQKMVQYYWKIAKAAAEKHLIVDFHGSYKPDGLRRAFPNVLTREGVKGLENNKWGHEITPSHDLILPFTRMFAGPMDYTPGAMINATAKEFHPVWSKPMSQGTRCHQLALYVVFESPLQMLADNPSHYRKEPISMQFIQGVPVVWDETQVLEAVPGKKLVLMRRSGNDWYIAGLSDWTERDVKITLPGTSKRWSVQIWKDGINASRDATDIQFTAEEMSSGEEIELKMANGGGFVIKITEIKF